jgi:hypothetical protein
MLCSMQYASSLTLHFKSNGRHAILSQLMAKTSQFNASCKDSKKLPVSWIYKTAKIFPADHYVVRYQFKES